GRSASGALCQREGGTESCRGALRIRPVDALAPRRNSDYCNASFDAALNVHLTCGDVHVPDWCKGPEGALTDPERYGYFVRAHREAAFVPAADWTAGWRRARRRFRGARGRGRDRRSERSGQGRRRSSQGEGRRQEEAETEGQVDGPGCEADDGPGRQKCHRPGREEVYRSRCT